MITTIDQYFAALPEERIAPMTELRKVINKNIPKGFAEAFGYGMPSWVVPLSVFPAGYHCNPRLPLGFVSIASQKNFISLHHIGMYASPELLEWFVNEYPKHSATKLDMGKGCVRFKKPDQIPFKLIGELMKKMPVKDWIALYEKNLNNRAAAKK